MLPLPGLVPPSEWRAEHEVQPQLPAADVAVNDGIALIGGTIP